MAAWKKKFERWKNAKAPVDVAEVEALLSRVFGSRLREQTGTSHRWHIDVTELQNEPGFALPNLPVCVRGNKVIPIYLQRAYEAAERLGLYPPPDDEDETDEDDTQEPNPHEQDP